VLRRQHFLRRPPLKESPAEGPAGLVSVVVGGCDSDQEPRAATGWDRHEKHRPTGSGAKRSKGVVTIEPRPAAEGKRDCGNLLHAAAVVSIDYRVSPNPRNREPFGGPLSPSGGRRVARIVSAPSPPPPAPSALQPFYRVEDHPVPGSSVPGRREQSSWHETGRRAAIGDLHGSLHR
jgi:hypothetical protein